MITTPPPPSAQVLRSAETLSPPAYLIDQRALERNLAILRDLAETSGARIVLAQKAFAQPQLYPLIGQYLHGACASGPWEAQLARDFFPEGAEILTCAPAYTEEDIHTLLPLSTHLDFNSLTQWERFKDLCLSYTAENGTQGSPHYGLRINPEHSTGDTPLYDPCAPGSRLGVTVAQLHAAPAELLAGLTGLHFHTLCEQGVEDLAATLREVEEHFLQSSRLPLEYLNIGGGHWITKEGYDRDALVAIIKRLTEKYGITVYLEPGEAVAIHSGVLIATVLDLHRNGEVTNALLNISATAHMPDVLEMPYRPDVYLPCGEQASERGDHQYRLTGNTCLAGDQIGDYAFTRPLVVGDKVIFNDMAHYTMVKTTFFNGVPHPSILLLKPDQSLHPLRTFSYNDYKGLKGV